MPPVQQPTTSKKSKSQIKSKDAADIDDSSFKVPSQANLKRLVKKYEELNEQSFSEFVRYYNGNIYQHVIINFNAFL